LGCCDHRRAAVWLVNRDVGYRDGVLKMATTKIEGFILAQENWSKNGYIYTWSPVELKDHGYMTVMPKVLEFELPDDFNPVAAMMDALMSKRKKIQAEFTARIAEINDQISNLQALTFNPTEVVCMDS
jgi:hypothetical protein